MKILKKLDDLEYIVVNLKGVIERNIKNINIL